MIGIVIVEPKDGFPGKTLTERAKSLIEIAHPTIIVYWKPTTCPVDI
jgi:hypothetical protein